MEVEERFILLAEHLRDGVAVTPPPIDQVRRRSLRRRVSGAVGVVLVGVIGVGILVAGAGESTSRSIYSGPHRQATTGTIVGPPHSAADLGACIPVSAHDGTSRAAGCILSTDEYADPPTFDAMTQRLGGIPVYKDGSAKEQVGLMAGGNVGFVPNVLIPRLADLNACGVKLGIAFGPDGIPLDALCTELLHESGYPISFLQGHGY